MIINDDCLATMRKLPSNSIHACVTSPPYFGLCEYNVDGQYGHEEDLDDYLDLMIEVYAEVRRLLVEGGTCWIVIGDSSNNYSAIRAKGERRSSRLKKRRKIQKHKREKEILNVPIELGEALSADGWIYRNNLIWDKISAGTIAKSDTAPQTHEFILQMGKWSKPGRPMLNSKPMSKSILTYSPVADSIHPCPFPIGLASELIEAATEPGQTVLDCFAGTGTTLLAAQQLGRECIGIELNPEYCAIAEARISRVQLPLLFA